VVFEVSWSRQSFAKNGILYALNRSVANTRHCCDKAFASVDKIYTSFDKMVDSFLPMLVDYKHRDEKYGVKLLDDTG